jgi:hypothetical protein
MSLRRALSVALALAVLSGLAFAAWQRLGRAPAPEAPRARTNPPASAPAAPAAPPGEAPAVPDAASSEPPLGIGSVDLEEVRAALPDNLYWQTSAPTSDPALLEERERAKAFWNDQYGKILSGTGSEEEILAYFEHRMRASTDYIQFVDHLLERYSDDLGDQDLGLLHLAKRLHQARLEEIPRRLQEAKERKLAQDEARRAWREEQQAFEDDAGSAP